MLALLVRTIALEEVLVIWENAIVSMDSKASIALKVYVRCCVLATDNTEGGCAIAKRVGKAPSATFPRRIAELPTATDTEIASGAHVSARPGGKENLARSQTVKILLVRITELVSMASAIVRQGGKETSAISSMNKCTSVSRVVQTTECTISSPESASVTDTGWDPIVRKLCAIWTAALTANAIPVNVAVTLDGPEIGVNSFLVILGAKNTDNAEMGLAFVPKGGTDVIVLCLVVKMVVLATVSAP